MKSTTKRTPLIPLWLRSSQTTGAFSVVVGIGIWQLAYEGLARTHYFKDYAIHHFLSSPL